MYRLTSDSVERYQTSTKEAYKALFGRNAIRQLDMRENLMLFGQRSIQRRYGDVGIIKLPKYKTSDDQWYHIVHISTGLVIGKMQSDSLPVVTATAKYLRWTLDSTDPNRRMLIATYGTVVMTYTCLLQYEQVNE